MKKYKSKSNSLTLESYSKTVDSYIKNTPKECKTSWINMLDWLDKALNNLNLGDSILEIGSATNRDAQYIRSKGYKVQCSDGAVGFVERLKTEGEDAIELDVLKHEIPRGFNMIFANAVIQHFTPEEFRYVLNKINKSLNEEGIFVFSSKNGSGCRWTEEKIGEIRFMQFWQPSELRELVNNAGFEMYYANTGEGRKDRHWSYLIAKKTN